jgi:hypothetical protein
MEAEVVEFQISQLKLCNRKGHAYQVKPAPNTHLRGRPKKAPLKDAVKMIESCPCPEKKWARHSKCVECIVYHAQKGENCHTTKNQRLHGLDFCAKNNSLLKEELTQTQSIIWNSFL